MSTQQPINNNNNNNNKFPKKNPLIFATSNNNTIRVTSSSNTNNTKSSTGLQNALKDIASGTFGGFAQVLVGHPLDTIKVRLQTQVPDPQTGKMPFSGMRDCAQKTFAGEGLAGLYKGAASPLLGAALHNAGVFFAYGQAKFLTGANKRGADLNRYLWAGAIAGVPISLIETPVDLFKIKLQSQVGKGEYEGVIDCGRKVIARYGWRGAYQGFIPTILRNVPAFGLYFYFSEFGFRLINPPTSDIPPTYAKTFLGGLVGGAFAGFGFWGIVYPLEVVKTRMQSDSLEISNRKYTGTLDCFAKTYKEGGIPAFFKGYTPALVRALPVNAAIFCVVFSVKNALG
jgi:solute carrier family 25 carnitine/acylcarnitine transporter 20/29